MAYGAKTKVKKVTKKMKGEKCSVTSETQHKVPKTVDKFKKVTPKEVFGDNYKKPKSPKKTKKKKVVALKYPKNGLKLVETY